MKNNKYAPYILGVALVIVWGLVFYKIYKAVYGEEDLPSTPTFQTLPIYKGEKLDSNFALLLDYKDPFLGKEFIGHSSSTNASFSNNSSYSSNSNNFQPKKNNPAPKQNANPKTPIQTPPLATKKPFPPIVYQGFQIMEMDTIAILKIDGKFYPNARKGQCLNNIGINAIFKDSVQLLFQGEQQTFSRKK